MAASFSPASPDGKAEQRDTPSRRILLDIEGYIADCSNATTAWSKTSTGVPISVSFCISRPPILSHFFVHCPGGALDLAALSPSQPPKAICSDADLVLLRVPLDPIAIWSQSHTITSSTRCTLNAPSWISSPTLLRRASATTSSPY
ncbi:unnamed protein product [Urochloa humidicola]